MGLCSGLPECTHSLVPGFPHECSRGPRRPLRCPFCPSLDVTPGLSSHILAALSQCERRLHKGVNQELVITGGHLGVTTAQNTAKKDGG